MKKNAFFLIFILIIFVSCEQNVSIDEAKIINGCVKGTVVCENTDTVSDVTITLVPTEGVFSSELSAISRSITKADAIQLQTEPNGSYIFKDVIPGIYTIYASMSDSVEKAVNTNVLVRSNETVTASTLKLTATGKISGYINIEGNSSENLGTIVFIAGTGFLGMTDSSGSFEINNVPAGKEYQLVVMKGSYVSAWTKVTVNAYETVSAGVKNISSSDFETRRNTLEWKGSFENSDYLDSPLVGWAYFNLSDGCSYIYDGIDWTLLAKAGSKGENGSNGTNGLNGENGISINWKGELKNPPENPEIYWAYYDTETGCSYIWTGSKWDRLSSKGEDGKEGTNGTNGKDGDDGNSIIWIGERNEVPEYAELYWAYFNLVDGCSYIYDGSSWNMLSKAGSQGEKGQNGTNGTNGVDGKSITWLGELDEQPVSAELYDAYYDTNDGCSYIFDGEKWTLLTKAGTKGSKGDNGINGKDGLSLIWKGAFDNAPTNPELYWAYYNIANGCSYIWNGTIWQVLAKDSVNIIWKGCLDAEPATPEANWAYYDNNFHAIFVYDGEKWNRLPEPVKQNAKIEWIGSFSEAPENPNSYNAYFNTEDGCSYIFIENEWQILASPGESGLNGETADFVSVENFSSYLGAKEGDGPFVIALEGNLTSEGIPAIKDALNNNYSKTIRLDLTQVTGLTTLPTEAFYYCSSLEAIALPNSVKIIGSSAFNYCRNLKIVKIGSSVKEIGTNAFYDCSSLESIILPDTLNIIGQSAFTNCEKLSQLVLPDNIISIGDSAFSGTRITSMTIPASIKNIGTNVFSSYCENIVIEAKLKEVPEQMFKYRSSLKTITLPDSITKIGKEAFYDCTSLTSIIIPDGVQVIGESAFYGCENLSSINIPDGVKTIGERAFYACKDLEAITIPSGIKTLEVRVFDTCNSLKAITIPNTVTTISEYAFNSCISLETIEITEGVKAIGNFAFSSCSSLETIIIPDSVESLGEGVFAGCANLTSVTLPEIPGAITKSMFQYCTSLTSIDIPASVTAIPEYAFSESGLVDFEIPNTIVTISDNAFKKCKDLLSITIPDSVLSIGEMAFYECSKLVTVNFGNNITSIRKYCFADCTSLVNVTLPPKLGVVATGLFSGCSNLTTVTLGNMVTSIEDDAFHNCRNLTSITLSDSLTTIGECAFQETALRSINLPSGLTSIKGAAFYKCSYLQSITIPSGVTELKSHDGRLLDWGLFEDCTSLSQVILHDNITAIGECAFRNCPNLASIVIPASVETVGDYVFSNCTSLSKIYVKGYTEKPDTWSEHWLNPFIASSSPDTTAPATVIWNYSE